MQMLDILKIARSLAGYTLGAADSLRKAMGKKIKVEMDAQREVFVNGSMANGIDEKKAIEADYREENNISSTATLTATQQTALNGQYTSTQNDKYLDKADEKLGESIGISLCSTIALLTL